MKFYEQKLPELVLIFTEIKADVIWSKFCRSLLERGVTHDFIITHFIEIQIFENNLFCL